MLAAERINTSTVCKAIYIGELAMLLERRELIGHLPSRVRLLYPTRQLINAVIQTQADVLRRRRFVHLPGTKVITSAQALRPCVGCQDAADAWRSSVGRRFSRVRFLSGARAATRRPRGRRCGRDATSLGLAALWDDSDSCCQLDGCVIRTLGGEDSRVNATSDVLLVNSCSVNR